MSASTSRSGVNLTEWTSGGRHSYQPAEIGSLVKPLLGRTSIGGSAAQSKLPVELLLLIFNLCDSAIRPRLVLTHTCQRWRRIAVSYPRLWTNLHIKMRNVSTATSYKHFESLLIMQVDRSGGLPLDVVWIASFEDLYAIQSLCVIRDKAPFSRWRSVKLWVGGSKPQVKSFLGSIVAFPNLESLVISDYVDIYVAMILCRAAMPKLQMLDLRAGNDLHWEETVIMSLNTHRPPLPITTLHVGVRERHTFPGIINYKLGNCIFRADALVDLRSMTSLIVDDTLHVFEGCGVLLPALQYLRLMSMSIDREGKIEAPLLQTLHLSATPDPRDPLYTRYNDYHYMGDAVDHPGYLLSPKVLIIHKPYLSKNAIIGLLKKSHELTQATLCFNGRSSAQEIVEMLFESITGHSPSDERLCPRLAELMLDWWGADMPISAEQWLHGVEGRKENPQRPRVSIKARRRGEEWYELLGEW
jgi:F-box-like